MLPQTVELLEILKTNFGLSEKALVALKAIIELERSNSVVEYLQSRTTLDPEVNMQQIVSGE